MTKKTTKKPSAADAAPAENIPKGTEIGEISHFFDHILVAVLKVKKGTVKVGDTLILPGKGEEGKTEWFEEAVTSMEVDHKKVESAKAGDEVGMKVSKLLKKKTVYKK